LKEDDSTKRVEIVDTLLSRLEELEQHLVSTKMPFFGGLKLAIDYRNDI